MSERKGAMENNRGLKVLSVRGVPIYLKPSWFMLMLLVCVGYPVYLYQQSQLAWSSAITIALSLGGLVALGVLIHELGHALTAVALKVRVQYISLTLWGGATKVGAATPWSSLIISLAGPIVNLMFAALLWILSWNLDSQALAFGTSLAASANTMISLFNLIPAYPLDGGHTVEALVTAISGRRSTGMKAAAWISLMLIPAMVVWWFFQASWHSTIGIIILVMVCWYLWSTSFPLLSSPALQTKNDDSLKASELLIPAQLVPVNATAQDFLAHGNTSKPVILMDGNIPKSWVEPALLQTLVHNSSQDSHLSQLSTPLPAQTIPQNALRVDVMEYFNGGVFEQLPQAFQRGEIPLAYPVTDGKNIVGLVFHRQISERLYAESAYLRRSKTA